MNIFNNTKLTAGQGQSLDAALGAQLGNTQATSLDPETLKLLEQQSVDAGVDFTKVLEASQKGHDPEATLELLAKEQNKSLKDSGDKLVEAKQDQSKTQTPVKAQSHSFMKSSSSKLTSLNGKVIENSQKNESIENSELSQLLNTEGQKSKLKQLGKTVVKSSSQDMNQAPETKVMSAVTKREGDAQVPKSMTVAEFSLQGQKPKAHGMQQAAMMNPQVKPSQAKPVVKNNNLVDFNSFMAKQSPSTKKTVMKSAYKPMTESMFNKKVEASLPGAIKAPAQQTKLQDIMFTGNESQNSEQFSNMMQNSEAQSLTKNNAMESTSNLAKVFDINSLTGTESNEELISKIENYIIQTKSSNQSQLNVSVADNELGQIDLQVKKAVGDQLDIQISSHKVEGLEVLTKNQGELLSRLSQAGIQVGEFKLDSSSNSFNQNLNQDSSKQQFAGHEGKNQHNSQSGQQESDARRRSELWEQFSEKEAA